jgi:hypothetical protein
MQQSIEQCGRERLVNCKTALPSRNLEVTPSGVLQCRCRCETSETISELDRVEPRPPDACDVERRADLSGADECGVVLGIERV